MQFFQKAIEKALELDNTRRKKAIVVKFKCDIVLSNQYPELSIVDYLLWALQRYILKGEDRFFMALRDKYNLIIDFDKLNLHDLPAMAKYAEEHPTGMYGFEDNPLVL